MPQTESLSPDASGLARAAALLAEGGLVAFPTETVYGLGGDARGDRAVAGIYAATLAVYADDKSEDGADTRAFLDRRIDGIMRFEKAKAKWLNPEREHFSPARLLGRLRYPAR